MLDSEFLKAYRVCFNGVLGVSYEYFELMQPAFDEALFSLLEKKTLSGKPRMIPLNFRCPSLQSPELRRCFVLHILKNNSLQQSTSATFQIHQSTVSGYYSLFTKALTLAPYRLCVNLEELVENPEVLEQILVIDGTERPVERDTYEQKEFYR